ncbi:MULTISPECIES: response regulator [Alphaproteobacteria]|uniref:DNA-binding response regulator n=2 Tax=Alphaproteobacteria TaxID=28211 RepID=A0A512HD33_9HYPH|nr:MULTISPECIES: response regulator [Alphaproteobacteria]GEO83359.1 DNA-binding response regulator [Ciceribacter naphthalenivorans]GLR20247.1 DNA-binding response regulator [Ciceribacter naphthalenivorans]GLT03103.1 DNA-binding response regulator [Sphingomonas psychrolutea]
MAELVLIAEDDPEIAGILEAYFTREGFRTVHARDGQVALDLHRSLKPDIVLADITMPRLNGWELLAEIQRRGRTPVIMITALDEDIDRLQGLRIGADDYIVKPFNPIEVVARARAVLRRAGLSQTGATIRAGNLTIDLDGYQATIEKDGSTVSLALTLTEFRLLAHLARTPTKAFSRSELVDACLPGSDALDRTIDSHLSKLRKKLEQAGSEGMLTSIRGVGYRLAVDR